MPVYNTPEEYLRPAVESILGQTFADFEFLVLDDGSTENNVQAVVRSYADPRIVFLENEKNLGLAFSCNKLIDLSAGEYLARMDSDDISLPERLQAQVDFLDSRPEVGVVGCAVEKFPRRRIVRYPENNSEIEETLMYTLPFEHPSMMFRKDVLLRHGLRYDESCKAAEDLELCCRMIGKTQFANLPQVLFRYRSHKKNITHLREQTMKNESGIITSAARAAHPEIWRRAESNVISERRYRLFGFVPLLTERNKGRKTKYLLFGCIPLMIRKDRQEHFQRNF
jgi:glycosyltransferase involved in cell wall biosynthesis